MKESTIPMESLMNRVSNELRQIRGNNRNNISSQIKKLDRDKKVIGQLEGNAQKPKRPS